MKREFPVFGFLGHHRVRGVIDEIAELSDSQEEQGKTERSPRKQKIKVMRRKKFGISDLKTRVEATLPEERRTRAARIQLSVYYQLLSAMVDGTVDMNRLYSELELDCSRCFGGRFVSEAGDLYADKGITLDVLHNNNCLDVWVLFCVWANFRNYGVS